MTHFIYSWRVGIYLLLLIVYGNALAETDLSCSSDSQQITEISESKYVRIGGVKQWITIKGQNCANPIVLIIHGGPGNPLSLYHDNFYHKFEENFTVVHWDQRGAGRTYQAQLETGKLTIEKITNSQLNIDVLVKDGLEVSDYLRRRLRQEKIIISGASWGAFLATKMVYSAPEKYHFYVALSPLVNGLTNYVESFKKVKAIASEKNDKSVLNILNGIGAPPWDHPVSFGKFRRVVSRYENETISEPLQWQVSEEYRYDESSPTSVFAREFSFLKYVGLNGDGMIRNVTLDECCTELNVPIYLIQGQKDLLTLPVIARALFEKISAPEKTYIALEHSGHDATKETIDKQLEVLINGRSRFIKIVR